jgi:predicted dinucleotide-utilizing enzyme
LNPVCSRGHLLDRVLQDSFLDHVAVRVLNPGLVADRSQILDKPAVTAAAEGKINAVRMISRKPVKALLGAAHLVAKGIDISNLKEPMKVFSGSAAEAAIGFPENLNVAAALGLAGIGAEGTHALLDQRASFERCSPIKSTNGRRVSVHWFAGVLQSLCSPS